MLWMGIKRYSLVLCTLVYYYNRTTESTSPGIFLRFIMSPENNFPHLGHRPILGPYF